MTPHRSIDAFLDAYGCIELAHEEVAESLADGVSQAAALQHLCHAIAQYSVVVGALEEAIGK